MGRFRTKTVNPFLDPLHAANLAGPSPRQLQEVERERSMDGSAIRTDQIVVNAETIDMLAAISMPDLPGVEKQADATIYGVCEGNRRN